tara:strand:+ start:1046 stop:1252 length:207 start_codon:yes stop_codon:yes gene_type:complete
MRMVSEAMFDLMMHMIGYDLSLEEKFKDVMSEYYKDEYDEELIFELATWCDDRWRTRIVEMLNKLTEE